MPQLSDTTLWLKHLPNKLTLARIAVIPALLVTFPFVVSLGQDALPLRVVCALLFAFAAITDLLDGYLARKYENVTPLGALLDPIADKMLIASSLVLLAYSRDLHPFFAGVMISRDLAINGIRLLAMEQNFKIEVSDSGKWKTTVQGVAIFCLFLGETLFRIPFGTIGMLALWISLALSLYSAWQYARGYLDKAKTSL